MFCSKEDKETLRNLGQIYMGYASLPIQQKKAELWKALNRCQMQRPMITIDQIPWHEFHDEALICRVQDPFWQEIEQNLRRKIYQWKRFPADMVLEPFFDIPAAVCRSDYGITVEEDVIKQHADERASSHYYKPTISEMEDIEKIKDITISYDKDLTAERLTAAKDVFAGIGPVRPIYCTSFHLGVWDKLSQFLGVENVYFDLVDRPEFLHAAMRRITDATLAGIRRANELMIHDSNINTCHCNYIYTDELLPGFNQGGEAVSENCWAFAMAQLFTSVSPEVTAEFEIPYISEMAEQFGMFYYGCCERLDDRLDYVKKIPHLRKVSCSPWSNREAFAERIGNNLVMSSKPTPAYLSGDSMDETQIRQDLNRTIQCAKANNVNLELLLKDISTVRFDPGRLTRWSQIAIEIAENS